MKAVILAGGLGTRLRPLTFSIPKPLLPIGEKPILEFIFEHLRKFAIKEIILSTGYQSELIRVFCGDGSKFGVKIDYVKENKALGTAGPLSLMRDRFSRDETFVLMNGDVVTKLVPDLAKELLRFGKKVGTYKIEEFWVGIEHIDQFDEVLKELNKIDIGQRGKFRAQ